MFVQSLRLTITKLEYPIVAGTGSLLGASKILKICGLRGATSLTMAESQLGGNQ